MTLPKNVAELQGENVVFELECIDRMYLNLYVPQLPPARRLPQPATAAITCTDARVGRKQHPCGPRELRAARLRLHGLIQRIEGTHRYRLTTEGLGTVVFYQRTYARIIRPGLSVIPSTSCPQDLPMVRALHKLQSEIDAYILSKRQPEKLDSNTPTSSVQGL
jgi:hypothetical protein